MLISHLAQATVDVDLTLPGVVALVFGVLVISFPKILNYLVGAYLLIVGIILTFDITI